MSEVANPQYNPSGVADCIDTNKLPWMPLKGIPGMYIKPARASGESGFFSLISKPLAIEKIEAFKYLRSATGQWLIHFKAFGTKFNTLSFECCMFLFPFVAALLLK